MATIRSNSCTLHILAPAFLKLVQSISVLLISTTLAHASVILNTANNGELLGATGVEVNGLIYDVIFDDPSCIEAFSGCNETSDFAFQTRDDANAAGHALFNQVLTGIYDLQPELTNGIHSSYTSRGYIFIPYSVLSSQEFAAVEVVNYSDNDLDTIIGPYHFPVENPLNHGELTFAIFRETGTVSVPESGTLPALSLGLLALGLSFRRRQKA